MANFEVPTMYVFCWNFSMSKNHEIVWCDYSFFRENANFPRNLQLKRF